VTHGGWKVDAIAVKTGADILQYLADTTEDPDVVGVDEAFMIPNVAEVLTWIYKNGISVVVSTLDLGYQAKPFKEVEKMLPWATHVEKCSAICTVCGRDAFYTHKKHINDDINEIQVGGAEAYEPRCFQHHLAVNNKQLDVVDV
jgi:thymidine kinase